MESEQRRLGWRASRDYSDGERAETTRMESEQRRLGWRASTSSAPLREMQRPLDLPPTPHSPLPHQSGPSPSTPHARPYSWLPALPHLPPSESPVTKIIRIRMYTDYTDFPLQLRRRPDSPVVPHGARGPPSVYAATCLCIRVHGALRHSRVHRCRTPGARRRMHSAPRQAVARVHPCVRARLRVHVSRVPTRARTPRSWRATCARTRRGLSDGVKRTPCSWRAT